MTANLRHRGVGARRIVSLPAFKAGLRDAQAGVPFRTEYETWPTSRQHAYEMARQLYAICGPAITDRDDLDKAQLLIIHHRSSSVL